MLEVLKQPRRTWAAQLAPDLVPTTTTSLMLGRISQNEKWM